MGDIHSIKVPWEPSLDLGACFVHPLPSVRRSPLYQFSLVLVAGAMLLVPVVYLAIIGAVGYGTWWHATENLGRFTDWGSSGHGRYAARAHVFMFLVGYVGPLLAGVIVILSLLKPVIVPRGKEREGQFIDAVSEPVIYAFVTRMCEVMGAPAPERIEVDASINASAGTRGGILGAIFSRRLVLTIGLPLVTGMRLDQLAAVIAHELGHFCQGGGMRATYLIHAVHGWLYDAVYRRDRLDWWVVGIAEAGGWGVALSLVARLCLALARFVLWLLLMASHLLTMNMSRQMEHDADRAASAFSGSAVYESMSRRIDQLTEAESAAQEEVRDYFRQNKLPDDLPALLADCASRLSADARDRVEKQLRETHTSFFETHPAKGVRIARARGRADEGVFACDRPARVLFKDLRSLCVNATRRVYRKQLGGDFTIANTVSTADLLRVNAGHTARVGAIAEFLGFEPPDWRPMFPGTSALTPAEEPRAALAKLKEARGRLKEASAHASEAARAYREADQAIERCEQVAAHFRAGLRSLPKGFDLKARTREAAERLKEESRGAAANAAAALDEALEAGSARLVWALRVLLSAGADRAIPGADRLRERARAAYPALIALRDCLPAMRRLRTDFNRAAFVLSQAGFEGASDALKATVRPLLDEMRDDLSTVRSTSGGVKYPFENPSGEVTVAGRLIDDTPGWRDVDAIMSAADRATSRYPEEVRRVLGELVEIARTVEGALARRAREKTAAAPGAPVPRA